MSSLSTSRQAFLEKVGAIWDQATRGMTLLNEERASTHTLKAELSALKHRADALPSDAPADQPTVTTVDAWKERHDVLRAKYHALKIEFAKAKELLRKRTESRKEWISYADSLETLAAKDSISAPSAAVMPGRDNIPHPKKNSTPRIVVAAPERPNVSFSGEPEAMIALTEDALLPNLTPTDITSLEPAVTIAARHEPDGLPQPQNDDTASCAAGLVDPPSSDPVVTSHRDVRKRKAANDLAQGRIRRIKTEIVSSSPVANNEPNTCDTLLDLDTTIHVVTPRRRPTVHYPLPVIASPLSERSRLSRFMVHVVSSSSPPPPSTHAPSLSESRSTRSALLQQETANALQAIGGIDDEPSTPAKCRRSTRVARALQEISPNKRMASAEDAGGSTPLIVQVQNGSAQSKSKSGRSEPPNLAPSSRAKVRDSVNHPAATPAPKSGPRGLSQSAPRPRLTRERERSLLPGRRSLPWGKEAEEAARAHKQRKQPKRDVPLKAITTPATSTKRRDKQDATTTRPPDSLRTKPTSELRLDDFKINPRVNHGENFAFTEVVRGRDERAALPGCTDANCCGKDFRAMALADRAPAPRTGAQRAEEERLLSEFLGDAAYKIPALTPDERDKLWLEAKTRQLATRFGRHKHRFQRATSPPGFWNADFPTTQEMKEEKILARQREQDAVVERYREAMRGGRWLFRDE